MQRRHWTLAPPIVLILLIGNRGFRSLVANSLTLRESVRELDAVQREQVRIQAEIDSLRNGHGLEAAARRQLGMQKPGEIEYRFPPPKPMKEIFPSTSLQ